MKKYLKLLGLTGIVILLSFRERELPSDFVLLLQRSKLEFIPTPGMVQTKCVENRQMNYEYALKVPEKNFEVRYALRPLDSSYAEYERDRVKPGVTIVNPNNWGKMSFQATLMNINMGSEAGFSEITYFDSAAVKSEFNADWGGMSYVNLGKEFGGEIYKYCVAVVIHKDYIGDAYFFYVSDDKEKIGVYMEQAFHSMKFK